MSRLMTAHDAYKKRAAATARPRVAAPGVVSAQPVQKRQRLSGAEGTRCFQDDVPIAEQLDFLQGAVNGGGDTSSPAACADRPSGALMRSLSATRRAVTADSDSKKAAERAAEQRFIDSASAVPLVPPKQQRLSKAALKRQQLRGMDPTNRLLPSASAAAVGGNNGARPRVAAPKLAAGVASQQRSPQAGQKRAQPFDF